MTQKENGGPRAAVFEDSQVRLPERDGPEAGFLEERNFQPVQAALRIVRRMGFRLGLEARILPDLIARRSLFN